MLQAISHISAWSERLCLRTAGWRNRGAVQTWWFLFVSVLTE